MRLEKLPKEFNEALPVLRKLQQAGYEAYFVGGSVRDALLKRPIHDVDIATNAYPAEVKQVFRRTIDIGIEHGTVLVLAGSHQYEITTFRTESKYTDYRRPDKVTFVAKLSEDLLRRDFTINAFAMTETGEIIDYFDGLQDLKQRKLKAVGKAEERFSEDALRIMRAMRFAATLDFEIEEKTLTAMKSHAHLLEKISIERIFTELDKLLLAKHWQKGLQVLIETQALQYLPDFNVPDLSDLAADFQFSESALAWAWLTLQFGELDLKKWKVSNDLLKKVEKIVAAYQESIWTLENVYRYGQKICQLADQLKLGQGQNIKPQDLETIVSQLQIRDKSEIVIKGADLIKIGFAPGPKLGRMLSDIEHQIVNNNLKNNQKEIINYVKKAL